MAAKKKKTEFEGEVRVMEKCFVGGRLRQQGTTFYYKGDLGRGRVLVPVEESTLRKKPARPAPSTEE